MGDAGFVGMKGEGPARRRGLQRPAGAGKDGDREERPGQASADLAEGADVRRWGIDPDTPACHEALLRAMTGCRVEGSMRRGYRSL